MFKHLKWDSVKRAVQRIKDQGIDPDAPLTFVIRLHRDSELVRRQFAARSFETQMWALYDNRKLFSEVAVVDKATKVVIYHYTNKPDVDEGMPIAGDPDPIKNWNKLSKNEQDAYMYMLQCQIESDWKSNEHGQNISPSNRREAVESDNCEDSDDAT